MRWGPAVAAPCLALLAWFRLSDDQPALAALFAIAALAQAYLSIRSFLEQRSRQRATSAPSKRAPERRRLPPQDQVSSTLDVFRRRRKGWLRLATIGWVLAGAGILLFPPTGVSLAAMSLFATLRFRYYDRYVPVLERALAGYES
jgi:hypothetical protein